MSVNAFTENLPPYPMEELSRIKAKLVKKGVTVYDFGTGDPRIPTWEGITKTLKEAIPEVSQYPSVYGIPELREAISSYLRRRFALDTESLSILPTQGSKEAIFHMALILVGRAGGKRHFIYPNPGYPVYRSSIECAKGIPVPVTLSLENNYKLEPWLLPHHIQKDACALWINYPHNPTGTVVDRDYFARVIQWGQDTDTVILSDDCYVDIYNPDWDWDRDSDAEDRRPTIPITVSTKGVISFLSLSKRSGMTGFRSGFMAGDCELVSHIAKARANFGVATPVFIQQAAKTAWEDDEHVAARRVIFRNRLQRVGAALKALTLVEEIPDSTFYLWGKVPDGSSDIQWCLKLAEEGVIVSPSQWLSEGIRGHFRMAMVPDEESTEHALTIIERFVTEKDA